MDATADELAGVIDLFGGLTRPELERALSEAAFRADGQSVDEDALDAAVDDALESFALVEYDRSTGGERRSLLVAGPTAFPSVPDHAEDVPHILDVDRRKPDRDALGETVSERFADAVDDALDETSTAEPEADRLERLIDVSYDIEAWAPVDLAAERERLEAALDD